MNDTLAARTVIAAHRGGAALNPENSRAAFRHAIALGADQIESDVHLSADDEPVLMHDATLERTTLGSGSVHALTLAELRAVRLRGADEVVPHLDELLELLRPSATGLRLELKQDSARRRYPGLCERVLRRLRRADMAGRTTVSSFDWISLDAWRQLAPEQPVIGLVKRALFDKLGGLDGVCREALAHGLPEIAVHDSQHQAGAVERAAAMGLRLGLYAVNEPASIRHALADGVCAFTTDRPDLALLARRDLDA